MPEQNANTAVTNALNPEEITNRSFASVRKGLDPTAVQRFLKDLASQVREARAREASLRMLLDTAEQRASTPQLDEVTLAAAVGAETARVLQAAHEAAAAVTERAEARAAAIVAEAEHAHTTRAREAEEHAATLLERAQSEARTLVDEAREESRSMLEEARTARRRVLEDLADRRRVLHGQLEQLRAGKDSLREVVDAVVASVHAVRERLDHAEEEAQAAAGTVVGRTVVTDAPAVDAPAVDAPAVDASEQAADVAEAASNDATLGEQSLEELPVEERSVEEPSGSPSLPTESVREFAEDQSEDRDDIEALERLDVDALFARLRATSVNGIEPDDESASPHSLSDDEEVVVLVEQVQGVEALEGTEVAVPGHVEASEGPVPGDAGEVAVIETEISAVFGTDDTDEAPLEGDDAFVAQRDALLDPVAASLSSALKRALASEQNELLDAVRHLGRGDPAALLPGVNGDRLLEALRIPLQASFEAGARFGCSALGFDDQQDANEVAALEADSALAAADVGRELAQSIVVAVSRRLSEGASDIAGDQGALTALAGLAYREWRARRVEGAASDAALQAFVRGTSAVAQRTGALLRWIADDGEARCPDCDDNALAGSQEVGEAFPTGHAGPPVHAACRCVLVPLPA